MQLVLLLPVVALAAFGAYILMQLAVIWLRGLLKFIAGFFPSGTWAKRVKDFLLPTGDDVMIGPKVAPATRSWTARVEHRMTAALGHYAARNMQPFSSFLAALATEIRDVSTQSYALANTVWHAMSYLVRHTIPALVDEGIADTQVRVGARSLGIVAGIEAVDQSIDRLRGDVGAIGAVIPSAGAIASEPYVDRGIDKLDRDLLSQLGAATAALYKGIDDLRNDIFGQEQLDVANVNHRIDLLRDLVAPAALAEAAVIAITRFAPELFCRNTGNVARKLCGLDTALLDAVLGLSLALLVVIDPVKIAQAALAAEEVMEPVIREVAA